MRPECVHFQPCGRADGGCCLFNLYGGQPSYGVCNQCGHNAAKGQPIEITIIARQPTPEELARAERERNEMTRILWREIHDTAIADKLTPEWLDAFAPRVPCGDCRKHWTEILKEIPPVFGAGSFEWTVIVHNAVNRRLGKPEMSVDEARKLYS